MQKRRRLQGCLPGRQPNTKLHMWFLNGGKSARFKRHSSEGGRILPSTVPSGANPIYPGGEGLTTLAFSFGIRGASVGADQSRRSRRYEISQAGCHGEIQGWNRT